MISWIDTGFAVTQGLALIATPCLLPILPIFLVAACEGGRYRPLGLLLGFAGAFSFFITSGGSRGIPATAGTAEALALWAMAAYGAILTSSRLSARCGRRLAVKGSEAMGRSFGEGVALGIPIGLIWPGSGGAILGATLGTVMHEGDAIAVGVQLVAFAVSATLPMLALTLAARQAIGQSDRASRHAAGLRKSFGIVVLAAVGAMALGIDPGTLLTRDETPFIADDTIQNGLKNPYPAPDFTGLDGWINGSPYTLARLKGKVVLIDFWTYANLNSLRALPKWIEWDRRYRKAGLAVIGVHSPQFEFEKLPANVRRAAINHGVRFPVALDGERATWAAFGTRFWPTSVLIDREGQVVYLHAGEGDYRITENNIRALLGLKKQPATGEAATAYAGDRTPETALGYGRAERFYSRESLLPDGNQVYHFPAFLPADHWALGGPWIAQKENALSAAPPPPVIAPLMPETSPAPPSAPSSLKLNFTAAKLYLVLGSADGKPVKVGVTLNGEPLGEAAGRDVKKGGLTVDHHRLYEIVDQKISRNSLLEVTPERPGLQLYAVTFAN